MRGKPKGKSGKQVEVKYFNEDDHSPEDEMKDSSHFIPGETIHSIGINSSEIALQTLKTMGDNDCREISPGGGMGIFSNQMRPP